MITLEFNKETIKQQRTYPYFDILPEVTIKST